MKTPVAWLAALCVVTFAIHHFSNNEADVDLWGNVGFVGAMPWQDGFHRTNTYSFTEPDRKWINHEWLAEYVYNRVFAAAGNPGLVVFKAALGIALLALLHSAVARGCGSGPIRFIFLLALVSTIGYGFSTRPHLFTYLFLALLLTALDRRWLLSPRLAPLWVLFAVAWANAHGAFFTGILTLLLYGTAAALARPAEGAADSGRAAAWAPFAWAAAFAALSLVNPYGPGLWGFVSGSAARLRPYLSEWAPFNPARDLAIHPDFVVLAVISMPCLLRPVRTPLPQRVLLAASLISALAMRRNIPLFAIVSAFTVPGELDARLSAPVKSLYAKIRPGALAAALLVFAALNIAAAAGFNKTRPFQMEVPRSKYPVDAVDFMKDRRIRGNMLVFFDWGEQAIWHLYPDCRVFMDGRFESAYSPEVINDYLAFLYPEKDWDRALTKYPTDIVLCHRDNAAAGRLRQRPGWRLAYEDDLACLFLLEDRHGAMAPAQQKPPPTESEPPVFP